MFVYSCGTDAAVVIQYHHVADNTPYSTSVSPSLFARQMDYLASHGFHVWPLPELIRSLSKGLPLTDRDIAITFDDGYVSVYNNALPILRKHGFPFTIFVTTSLVGGNGFMSWAELIEATKYGGTIANHTVSHPHLVRQLDGETDEQRSHRIYQEMAGAEDTIRRKIGTSPGMLAYPYGEYDALSMKIAHELGLVAFTQLSGAFDDSVDLQAIPRFAFGGRYGEMKEFIDKVNSLPMPLADVVIKDEHGRILKEPLLPVGSKRPVMLLRLRSSDIAKHIQCFATGIGRIKVHTNNDVVTTDLQADLPVGRSRINCTAPSTQPGRYYWFSRMFMRKNDDGSWYQE